VWAIRELVINEVLQAIMFLHPLFVVAWLGISAIVGFAVGRLYRSVLIGILFAATFLLATDVLLSRTGIIDVGNH